MPPATSKALSLRRGAEVGRHYESNFVDGVAMIVQPVGWAMVEAAIGGQQFTYQAK